MPILHLDAIIHFPAISNSEHGGKLLAQIEDTSEADAPAIVVSRLVIDVPHLNLTVPQTLNIQLPYTERLGDLTFSVVFTKDISQPPAPDDLVTPDSVKVRHGETAHIHLVEYHH